MQVSRKSTEPLLRPSIILFVLSVIMLLASVVNSSHLTLPIASKPANLHSTVTQGSSSVSVSGVATSAGGHGFTAPAGKSYAVITLEVTNTGEKPIQVLASSDTYLKDSDGNVAYLSPTNLQNPFRSGELLPGETITGELSYLVSNNRTYTLYIDGIWSGGVMKFALK